MKDRGVFIDTGFWIALFDSCDQHHAIAAESWSDLQDEHKLVTSAFILYETITYLNCSLKNHRLAVCAGFDLHFSHQGFSLTP